VQGELSKCKALAASTAPSRSEMELIQWPDHLSYEVACVECCRLRELQGLKKSVNMDFWTPWVCLTYRQFLVDL
jgi:hypothetical protein